MEPIPWTGYLVGSRTSGESSEYSFILFFASFRIPLLMMSELGWWC